MSPSARTAAVLKKFDMQPGPLDDSALCKAALSHKLRPEAIRPYKNAVVARGATTAKGVRLDAPATCPLLRRTDDQDAHRRTLIARPVCRRVPTLFRRQEGSAAGVGATVAHTPLSSCARRSTSTPFWVRMAPTLC